MGGVGRYVVQRILLTIPMIFILLTVVFLLLRVMPGDPVTAMLGGKNVSAEVIAEYELGPRPFSYQSALLAALIVFSAGATAIAWWREHIGGLLLLAAGIGQAAFSLTTGGPNRLLAMAISGGPFLVSGALFLLSSLVPPQPPGR